MLELVLLGFAGRVVVNLKHDVRATGDHARRLPPERGAASFPGSRRRVPGKVARPSEHRPRHVAWQPLALRSKRRRASPCSSRWMRL